MGVTIEDDLGYAFGILDRRPVGTIGPFVKLNVGPHHFPRVGHLDFNGSSGIAKRAFWSSFNWTRLISVEPLKSIAWLMWNESFPSCCRFISSESTGWPMS